MDKLLSDSAKPEISNKVIDILRAYHISNWHSVANKGSAPLMAMVCH